MKILVTGAVGQIGSELVPELRKKYGGNNVIATGHKTQPSNELRNGGPFEFIDVTKPETVEKVIKKYNITVIYILSSFISAACERNPQLAWSVNMGGLYNLLELARKYKLKVFNPSSMGAFGPNTPKKNTPQETILRPNTMYGVIKIAGELLCNYYFTKYGVDVRGVRYPGIIGTKIPPADGTTEYSIAMMYEAIKSKKYTCFLRKDSVLSMMYMKDALNATISLMEADLSKLKHHADFNLAAFSFSPEELAKEVKKHIPDLEVRYKPDFRQKIADSWPDSIDDSAARKEWGWKPKYNMSTMVSEILAIFKQKKEQGKL